MKAVEAISDLALLIYFAAMGNRKHQHAICPVFDPINDAPVSNAVTEMADKFARQSLDVIVPARLTFQLRKAPSKLSRQRPVGSREEGLNLWREHDLKHPTGPCANFAPGPTR